MDDLTPRQIVAELDRFVIGQEKAKKAVGIALRNRWRRQQVKGDMREEIMPNNIILIGSTGVGKTEISRRLANLANAPFVKVEASKFTEVGYVGRDVESIIRDLTDVSVSTVRKEAETRVEEKAADLANERILDLLFPTNGSESQEDPKVQERHSRTREKLRKKLLTGSFEDRVVEIDVADESVPFMQVFGPVGIEEMGMNLQDIFGSSIPKKIKRRRTTVSEARKVIAIEEAGKLIDHDEVMREAMRRVEESGIVFLDEIDKIVGNGGGHGPDVSREGVQRDILPVVEGCSVVTKYGVIRVEMDNLTEDDFVKILTYPDYALIKQYSALLETEGVTLKFNKASIREIASIATEVNEATENIGARRLHTIMTTLLEDILFETSGAEKKTITVTKEMVRNRLTEIVKDQDLSRYIL